MTPSSAGFAMGCGTSIAFAILGVVAALTVDTAGQGKLSDYPVRELQGVTRWIGILSRSSRTTSPKGRRKSVQGLIIAGCIGLLLSSALRRHPPQSEY